MLPLPKKKPSIHTKLTKPIKNAEFNCPPELLGNFKQNKMRIEYFQDKNNRTHQFKNISVKEYIDQFMPNKGKTVFKTYQDLMTQLVVPLNDMHSNCFSEEVDKPLVRYYITFTDKYAQLKCAGKDMNNK